MFVRGNEKNLGFSMVCTSILSRQDLTAGDKVVYSVLSYYASMYEHCYPSYDTIAAVGGISKSTAIRGVRNLCAKGVVAVLKDLKLSNTYIVADGKGDRIYKGCKRTSFVLVDLNVLRFGWMPTSVKLVYMGMLQFATMPNGCYPSYRQLSKIIGLSIRAVIDDVKLLIGAGLIDKIGIVKRKNWYSVIKKLVSMSVEDQTELQGFFEKDKTKKRKDNIRKAFYKAKQILNDQRKALKIQRERERGRWVKSKIQYDVFDMSAKAGLIDSRVLKAIYDALYDLSTNGVQYGFKYTRDDQEVFVSGRSIDKRMQEKLSRHYVYEAIDRLGDLQPKRLVNYLKVVLVSMLVELPPDFKYQGYLIKA